ncbi:MAG: LysR family transcriptional regulator [Alphaproteobacteria bacterium]|nr:LysR family transcriptional regulator [Alphaproteobacteria bacterium]
MRYTNLRSFQAVARAGGFTAAAAQMGISQPTLTAQIGALEAEFGVLLFHRRNRRVELTETGRDLLAITTRMFAEEKEALEFLEQSRELRTGHLRIAAVGPYHVTAMLAAFNRRYPGVRLSVSLGNSADTLDQLRDYRADVAVLAHIDEDDRLLAIPCRRHPVVVFTRTDHRLAGRPVIRLADLDGERMIVREPGSTTRRAFEAAVAAAGVAPEIVMEIGSREAIREAVIHGLGIGYVSEAEFVPDPSLASMAIADAEIFTYAHVVILRERRASRIVRAFVEVVREMLHPAPAAAPAGGHSIFSPG